MIGVTFFGLFPTPLFYELLAIANTEGMSHA